MYEKARKIKSELHILGCSLGSPGSVQNNRERERERERERDKSHVQKIGAKKSELHMLGCSLVVFK